MQTHIKTFRALAVVLVAVFACTSEPKKPLDEKAGSTTKVDKEQSPGRGNTVGSEPQGDIGQIMEPGPKVAAPPGIILPPKVELCPEVIPNPKGDGELPKDSYQCAVTFERLEEPLLKFLESGTKGVLTQLVEFFSQFVGIGAGIATIYATYRSLRRIPQKELRVFLSVVVGVAVGLLVWLVLNLLSDLIISALSALFVLVIIILVLLIAFISATLIKFIDEKSTDVRGSSLDHFSSPDPDMAELAKENIRKMQDWLSNICFIQILSGDISLKFDGSFVDGYDESTFEIQPHKEVNSHWENINDRMLIPIQTRLRVTDSKTMTSAEVINIQPGRVVIARTWESGRIEFKGLSHNGYAKLKTSVRDWQDKNHEILMDRQKQWAADL